VCALPLWWVCAAPVGCVCVDATPVGCVCVWARSLWDCGMCVYAWPICDECLCLCAMAVGCGAVQSACACVCGPVERVCNLMGMCPTRVEEWVGGSRLAPWARLRALPARLCARRAAPSPAIGICHHAQCPPTPFVCCNPQDALASLHTELLEVVQRKPVGSGSGSGSGTGTGTGTGKSGGRGGVAVHPMCACRACKTSPIYGNLYRCLMCEVG
jgi:hypothetical protein